MGVALLQLQQRVGGRCLVRPKKLGETGGMGALTADGGGGQSVNDRIRLHGDGDDARCARPLFPAVTHYSVLSYTFIITNSD